MPHVPDSKVLGNSKDVAVEKVLLSLVIHGSKETTGKWCETCFPLQAELAHCAPVPKAALLVPHKGNALKAQDKWNSMATVVESLGELLDPASLKALPPLGNRTICPIKQTPPGHGSRNQPGPYPDHSSVLPLELSSHTDFYRARLLEGRLGLLWLGEPAASGREFLLCCLISTDSQGIPCLAISPLLSGDEPV